MGCDIHSVAQIKTGLTWKTVYQDVAGDPRNYHTFAMLADVRNGHGFAGIVTGDRIPPISKPKGLPKDFELSEDDEDTHPIPKGTPSGNDWSWSDAKFRTARKKEQAEATSVWMGDHSHSWLLLTEIDAYIERMKNTRTMKRGCVAEKHYLEIRETRTEPKDYCGWVSGKNVLVMTEPEYTAMEKTGQLPKGAEIFVDYEWIINILDHGYLKELSAELHKLAKKYKVEPDHVRMVFGFDS